MKALELFCGTKSFSKVAKERGHDIFTIDFNPKFKPDLCCDMLYFDKRMLPAEWRKPEILWSSPPCDTFSLSGNSMFMGFPDGWTAGVSDTQRYKQMGNAVTVNVIEAIGLKLAKMDVEK